MCMYEISSVTLWLTGKNSLIAAENELDGNHSMRRLVNHSGFNTVFGLVRHNVVYTHSNLFFNGSIMCSNTQIYATSGVSYGENKYQCFITILRMLLQNCPW